jgi:hypothetical protein
MANTLLTTQEITFETLMILKNTLKFAANVHRGYDDQFAVKGRKIGATLNIRKPPRFIGRTGQAVNLEGLTDTYVPLTLNTQFGVDFEASSSEMALSIDDFKNRYLMAAAATIANKIDRDGLLSMYQTTANTVGAAGTTPNTFLVWAQAGQKLDEMGAPDDDRRTIVMNPAARVAIVDALKGLFQDSANISRQYKTAKMGTTAGFEWYQDQNVVTHTIGTFVGVPVVSGGGQSGSTLVTKTWTAGDTLNVGDWFTLGTATGGVFAVNPQSRTSTGSLQQFVVTVPFTAVGGGGNDTINIFPALLPSGQFQNVDSSPANNATLNIWQGTTSPSGKVTPQNMAWHESAYTMACVDLEVPGGIDLGYSARDKETGVSLRFIRQYVASTDQWISRFDVLYGWAGLYPELACRVAG